MWTIVDYLYRDAGNNKAFGQVALEGAVTHEEERLIRSKMPDDQLFIAEQIGLRSLCVELEKWSNGLTDEDHCWHELGGFNAVSDLAQIDGVTRWGAASDFADRFRALGRWDETLSPNYFLASLSLAGA